MLSIAAAVKYRCIKRYAFMRRVYIKTAGGHGMVAELFLLFHDLSPLRCSECENRANISFIPAGSAVSTKVKHRRGRGHRFRSRTGTGTIWRSRGRGWGEEERSFCNSAENNCSEAGMYYCGAACRTEIIRTRFCAAVPRPNCVIRLVDTAGYRLH